MIRNQYIVLRCFLVGLTLHASAQQFAPAAPARPPQVGTLAGHPDWPAANNSNDVDTVDPRFKGKVVLAIVTGTWCPNCHDEAQYLVQLDKKYHDKGLAIVALDFEEPEQQGTLSRERAFVKQYGVKYTYLPIAMRSTPSNYGRALTLGISTLNSPSKIQSFIPNQLTLREPG